MKLLGLFERQIPGDDALLELARLRFSQANLGAEMHAGAPEELERMLLFRPASPSKGKASPRPVPRELPVTAHLARDFVLPESLPRILAFAARFAGRIYGMTLHDHADLAARPAYYLEAARELDRGLARIPNRPWLFIEYAAGIDLGAYRSFLESTRDLAQVSACVDVGHVGIWRACQAFAERHPGLDARALKRAPKQAQALMADLEAAVGESLPAVLELIAGLGSLGKPVHFHLHDGHPLSNFSPYGVADHLSFLAELPLGFDHVGRRTAPLMFGPAGLARIVRQALEALGPDRVSFTLEIHPTAERLPLDSEAARLFGHWVDKTNAERMNHWLAMLVENQSLLLRAARQTARQ